MAALNYLQPLLTATMGMTTISTANSSLDGSGTLYTVLTGASNGTLVKNLIVKAQTDTSDGMIRIFVKKSGGSNRILSEYCVSAIIKSSRDRSFGEIIPINYTLEANEELRVSTQTANTFNIIAEAFELTYNSNTSFIGSSIQYFANAGTGAVDTANSNLNGSGSIIQIFTAGAYLGCEIRSIKIKAMVSTTPGMIRLFLQDNIGGSKVLFYEVEVPNIVQSGTDKSFEHEVIGVGYLVIPAGYSIWATTQVTEAFSIVISGQDWQYV